MAWKNWPYWLKGLIITSGIYIILFIISIIFTNWLSIEKSASSSTYLIKAILAGPGLIIFMILFPSCVMGGWMTSVVASNNCPSLGTELIIFVILSLIIYGLVGVLIGWGYGKIKNK